MRAILLAVALIAPTAPLFAQPGPEFEVAAVKPADMPVTGGEVHVGIRFHPEHGIFACDYCNLRTLIEWSYDLKDYQLSGPQSLDAQPFLVDARVTSGTTTSKAKQMMQALLADRFQLKFHRQQKDLPVLELVVGPKGPTLKAASPGARSWVSSRPAELKGTMGMGDVARWLSSLAHETVINSTAITGLYDIDILWTRGDTSEPVSATEANPALSDQLGLKLQRSKTPTNVFVVDSVLRVPVLN